MSRLVSLMVIALAAGCGHQERSVSVGDDFTVVIDSNAAFAARADFPGRVESTVAAALDYWGGTWADVRGVTLTLSDGDRVPCSGHRALGCMEGRDIRITTRDPSVGTFSCIEETVLVHEIGHAVIGDNLHEDPRWMEMDAISAALQDRPGYTDSGEGPCPIYLSVWRHPLGTR